MSIELTSTAFQQGATIPKQYTGDGADRSPPLRWSEPPQGTKNLAALDIALDLSPGATKPQLVDAMKGHILAEGSLVGIYGR